jgi:hypothetical protein
VLGHVVIEHRDEGPYCYGFFNQTGQGQNAKALVEHEDVSALSIFANSLMEKAKRVSHGMIREVSLVLAGANPGALIDNIAVAHADGDVEVHVDEAIIYTGLELESPNAETPDAEPGAAAHAATTDEESEGSSAAEGDEPTIQDVFDQMSDDQKQVVHFMVGAAIEQAATTPDTNTETGSSEEDTVTHEAKDENNMGRNVFEQNGGSSTQERHVLSHDAMQGIAADAVKRGSLKEAVETTPSSTGSRTSTFSSPRRATSTTSPSSTSVGPSGLRRSWTRSARARSRGSSPSWRTSPTTRPAPAATSRAP